MLPGLVCIQLSRPLTFRQADRDQIWRAWIHHIVKANYQGAMGASVQEVYYVMVTSFVAPADGAPRYCAYCPAPHLPPMANETLQSNQQYFAKTHRLFLEGAQPSTMAHIAALWSADVTPGASFRVDSQSLEPLTTPDAVFSNMYTDQNPPTSRGARCRPWGAVSSFLSFVSSVFSFSLSGLLSLGGWHCKVYEEGICNKRSHEWTHGACSRGQDNGKTKPNSPQHNVRCFTNEKACNVARL